jgi:hypothetical protein
MDRTALSGAYLKTALISSQENLEEGLLSTRTCPLKRDVPSRSRLIV